MNPDDTNSTIDTELKDLLAEVTEVNEHIDTSNQHARETLEHVEMRIDTATKEMEDMFTELDGAETEAEEDLDTLILTEIDAIVESEV